MLDNSWQRIRLKQQRKRPSRDDLQKIRQRGLLLPSSIHPKYPLVANHVEQLHQISRRQLSANLFPFNESPLVSLLWCSPNAKSVNPLGLYKRSRLLFLVPVCTAEFLVEKPLTPHFYRDQCSAPLYTSFCKLTYRSALDRDSRRHSGYFILWCPTVTPWCSCVGLSYSVQ